jgi:hypothetical protein
MRCNAWLELLGAAVRSPSSAPAPGPRRAHRKNERQFSLDLGGRPASQSGCGWFQVGRVGALVTAVDVLRTSRQHVIAKRHFTELHRTEVDRLDRSHVGQPLGAAVGIQHDLANHLETTATRIKDAVLDIVTI